MRTKSNHKHPAADELGVFWVPADHTIPMEYKMVGSDWQSMGRMIGGYIEVVRTSHLPNLPCGCLMVMVVDEDGLMKHKPYNRRVADYYPAGPIAGDVLLAGEGPVWNNRERCYERGFIPLPPEFNSWAGPGDAIPGVSHH